MFGPHWDDSNYGYQNTLGNSLFLEDSEKYGIIPKSIEHVFDNLSYYSDD
jgi:hypothetical protein